MSATNETATCSEGRSDGRSSVLVRGSIGEIAVFEVLQMVGILSLEDVCVSLQSDGRRAGRIWLHGDRVLHASAGSASGKRALRQLLEWSDGTFCLRHEEWRGDATIDEPLTRCLLDGSVALDTYRQLRDAGARFEVGSHAEKAALDERARLILELVGDRWDLDGILERSPLAELETLELLSALRGAGLIVAAA